MKFRINYESLSDFRQDKISKSIEILDEVLNSKDFKNELINTIEARRIQNGLKGELSKYQKLNGLELYEFLMEGSEELSPEIDYEMDLIIGSYYSWKNVVGYTYKNTKWIYINTKFLDRYNEVQVASNILHEYGHKLGFQHSRYPNHDDNFCYILNDVFERVAFKLFPEYKRTLKKCHGWWIFKKCK